MSQICFLFIYLFFSLLFRDVIDISGHFFVSCIVLITRQILVLDMCRLGRTRFDFESNMLRILFFLKN